MSLARLAKVSWCYGVLAFGIALLALMCLLWAVAATALLLVLPARMGRRVGRRGAMGGFRAYLAIMSALGAWRLDLSALDSLHDETPLIVAPNHPSLLDAVLVVSRLPDAFCVMKASLLGNFLLAPAARLARYVRNDALLALAARAGEEFREGGHMVLFPEGTRSKRHPVGPFTPAVGVVSRRTGVPVQAVFIHADTAFLGKRWSLAACPELPLHYRVVLGPRFEPPKDVRAFTEELERLFAAELGARQPLTGAPVPAEVRETRVGDPFATGSSNPE